MARLVPLVALVIAAVGAIGDGEIKSEGAEKSAPKPLLLITTGETPPYSYKDETTGEIVGTEIEIASAAAQKIGRTLEVRRAKFPELLPMVAAGEADLAASGITITEGRRQTVDFSVPYATEGGMYLYRTGEPMPTTVLAEQMRIATMDASTYDFYLSSHGVDPLRFELYTEALAAFYERRADAVFYDSCAVKRLAESSGGKLSVSRLETRENFGIAVRKGNDVLKKALDEVIVERKVKE